MLVAIEGIDGSGKRTITEKVAALLLCKGVKVDTTSFPQYGKTFASSVIEEVLTGRASLKDPYYLATIFALDRFEVYSRGLFPELLLSDRYTASNMAFQLARLPRSDWPVFARWVADFEFERLGLPVPNLNILLEIDAELARTLISKKPSREYTTAAFDEFEADTSYQDTVAAAYDYLARIAVPSQWQIVKVCSNGCLRDPDDIAVEVATLARACFLGAEI